MATTKIAKYVWLIDRLYNHPNGMTLAELQDDWIGTYGLDEACQMSPRTFLRLKTETEGLFGVDIECAACDSYRYRISRKEIDNDRLRKWLLDTFVVSNRIADSMQLKERILIEEVPSGGKYLLDILSAMKESNVIEMGYQSFVSSEPRKLKVEPYCLKANKRRWYVLGKTEKGLRVYALDRIVGMAIVGDEKFVMPETFDAEEYFANTIGVSVEAEDYEVETIRVKVYANRHKDKYLNTLPLHPSQKMVESGEEYSIFEYRLRATYEFFHEILALGDEAEVLSPEWVRKDMTWYVENMLKRYKN